MEARTPKRSHSDVMSNALEAVIRKAGRELMDYQVAHLFKVPEEMSQTPCDFFGYTSIGRAILLEAKHVNRTSLPIGTSNGLSPHQWNELCDANRAGCLALISWARGKVCKTISMDMAIAYSEGRKSIPWSSIPDSYGRHLKPSLSLELLDHWLPVAREATQEAT